MREKPRNKTVSFAGSYYNFSFAERKLDLDILLKPSLDFGLEIFDRNYGATGLAAEESQFPKIYRPAIKGKLAYNDMLDAYRAYKVFLNVNSVKYSSTMFARRVFELLACGTPVISNYSKGIISLLGEGTVFITESENDTRSYLEKLLGDEHYWWMNSLKGMRTVMEHHTYQERAAEIFAITGHNYRKPDPLGFLVLAVISSAEDARYILDLASGQALQPAGVVFIPGPGKSLPETEKTVIGQLGSGIRFVVAEEFADHSLKNAIEKFSFTHLAVFNANNYYGKNYLRDFGLAVKYSGARVLGKQESVSLKSNGMAGIPVLQADFRYVPDVPADTVVIEKGLLADHNILAAISNSAMTENSLKILSLDPFNFLKNGQPDYQRERSKVEEIIGI